LSDSAGERFNKKFPGFESDIHGLVGEENGEKLYYVDCVR
jgi:arginine decarboxylase